MHLLLPLASLLLVVLWLSSDSSPQSVHPIHRLQGLKRRANISWNGGTWNWPRTDAKSFQKLYCDHIIISYYDQCCVYLMMAWIHGFPEWVARHRDSHAHFVEQHSFTKHQSETREKSVESCRTSLISRSWNIVNPCKSKHSLLVW